MNKAKYLFLLAMVIGCSSFAEESFNWNLLNRVDSLRLFTQELPTGTLLHRFVIDDTTKLIEGITELSVEPGAGVRGIPSMKLEEKRVYDFKGKLISASQQLSSPAGANSWTLTKEKSHWKLIVSAGGQSSTRIIETVCENLNATYAIYKGIEDSSIQVGDVWYDTLIELMSGVNLLTTTRCVRTPRDSAGVWVFESSDNVSGRKDVRFIDKTGNTVFQEVAPFFVARPVSDSVYNSADVTHDNIFEKFGLENIRGASPEETIVVELDSSVDLDSSVLIFYKKLNNKYLLSEVGPTCTDKKNVNYNDSLKLYLRPTVTVQSDDHRIRSLASLLCKDMNKKTLPCEKIVRFNRFVDSAIVNRNTATFSSALETLGAGFGDCGEHAVLMAALLRAAGIPARVVIGLVYIKEKAGYFYHAWVMAHDGSQWIFSDPALGLSPSPRDRVPLLIDDNGDRAIHLARYIKRIKISYSSTAHSIH